MDRKEIAGILAAAGAKPRHQLGQNFMVDQAALRAVADAGEIGETDVVLEVGPGVGNLTRLLAQRASRGHVLAVDIDRTLMSAAQRHHASLTNITWLHTDILAGKHEIEPTVIAKLRELRQIHPDGQLKLVSNLPYNAASPLVAELLVAMWHEIHPPPSPPSPPSPPNSPSPHPNPQPTRRQRCLLASRWQLIVRCGSPVSPSPCNGRWACE